ncbi:hypothetical protein D3C84_509940 [compost metagenome]
MVMSLSQRLELALKQQELTSISPQNSTKPDTEKSKPSALKKLEAGIISRDLRLKEQAILIANLQGSLAIMQTNSRALKTACLVMTSIAVASVLLLLVIQR